MSVESISLVLNHSKAQPADKLVLIGIANHDGDGGAWPSIATLARYANMSERSVQYSLRRLEQLGELETITNAGGTLKTDPRYRTNRYNILLSGVKPTAPLDESRGARNGTLGVQQFAPEPSLEPSKTKHMQKTPSSSSARGLSKDQLDALWDALAEVAGQKDQKLTRSEAGRIASARKELIAVGATPDEIRARARVYRRKFPGITITATALAANWSTLRLSAVPKPPPQPNQFIVELEDGWRRNTLTGDLWNPNSDCWEPDPEWLYQEQRKPQ